MKQNKNYIYFLLIFIIVGFFFKFLQEKRYKALMSKTTRAKVIFIESFNSKNSGLCSIYSYSNNKKILIHGGKEFLKKGDTILIKYSINNLEVAEVIDFCYMKKHKGKDYCKCN